MKSALECIDELLSHPAPGLIFAAHDRLGLPRRAHPTPHLFKGAMSELEDQELARLANGAATLQGLIDFYRRSNGADLYILKCPNCEVPHPAISFLPVSEWAAATAAWQPGGEMAFCMEGCDLYAQTTWRVIASLPSEEMRLVQLFSGQYQGQDVAGRICCIGLDGYLGFDEVLAESFEGLLASIIKAPADFFNRLGFSWIVETDQGRCGDVIEGYTPNLQSHPDRAPWPPTRPLAQ
jgi:hypothetical protein